MIVVVLVVVVVVVVIVVVVVVVAVEAVVVVAVWGKWWVRYTLATSSVAPIQGASLNFGARSVPVRVAIALPLSVATPLTAP